MTSGRTRPRVVLTVERADDCGCGAQQAPARKSRARLSELARAYERREALELQLYEAEAMEAAAARAYAACTDAASAELARRALRARALGVERVRARVQKAHARVRALAERAR